MGTYYVAYKKDGDQFEVRQLSDLSAASNDTRLFMPCGRNKLETWLRTCASLLIRDRKGERKATPGEILAELNECGSVKFVVL